MGTVNVSVQQTKSAAVWSLCEPVKGGGTERRVVMNVLMLLRVWEALRALSDVWRPQQ